MRTLVIGGTGTVGSQTVRGLLDADVEVRVMIRSPEKEKELPKSARGVVGDLAKPETLPAAFKGVEAAFLITPISQQETELGRAAVGAARKAGVKRLVYMAVHKLESATHIPHFGSKIPVIQAIKESGLTYTLLEPNNFYQNDLWLQAPITQMGVYPSPMGPVGLNRVDVRDIAEAAVNVLTQSGHENRAYPLVGPDTLTGEQIAKIWSRALGREVRYVGDLDAWAAGAREMLPEWLVHDVRIMFEHFVKQGLVASASDLERCASVLGHPPRSFDAFAAETAKVWKG